MKTIKAILAEVESVDTPFERHVRDIHPVTITPARGRSGPLFYKTAKKDTSKLNPGNTKMCDCGKGTCNCGAMSESTDDVKYRYMSSVDDVLNEIGDLWSAYASEEVNGDAYKTLLRSLEDVRDNIETSLGVSLEPVSAVTSNSVSTDSSPEYYEDEGYDYGVNENFRQGPWKFNNGEEIKITKEEVDLLNSLRSKLGSSNAKHMEEKVGKSKKHFDELIDYARLVVKDEEE